MGRGSQESNSFLALVSYPEGGLRIDSHFHEKLDDVCVFVLDRELQG